MGVPLYEYECASCHHRFEKIESYSAPEKQKCPKCGKTAGRVLTAPAIQFKGSGWYVTDYGGKSSGADVKAGKSPDSSSAATPAKPSSGKPSVEKKA
ncbi:MAG TPA: zinc ribbon domain-containing protein [Candidatus Dormibacteraeota bacterium]|nr:zinc ribbon domain-containing protein [Candidatus Dormibacteraeota bacterium]